MDVNEELKFLRKFTKQSGGGEGRGTFGLRGQGGCERRIDVFVKIQKKNFIFFFLGGGGGSGVRMGGQGGCE